MGSWGDSDESLNPNHNPDFVTMPRAPGLMQTRPLSATPGPSVPTHPPPACQPASPSRNDQGLVAPHLSGPLGWLQPGALRFLAPESSLCRSGRDSTVRALGRLGLSTHAANRGLVAPGKHTPCLP